MPYRSMYSSWWSLVAMCSIELSEIVEHCPILRICRSTRVLQIFEIPSSEILQAARDRVRRLKRPLAMWTMALSVTLSQKDTSKLCKPTQPSARDDIRANDFIPESEIFA